MEFDILSLMTLDRRNFMPYPTEKEDRNDYIKRFMESEEAKKDYPDEKQRVAVAYSLWREHSKAKKKQRV